MTTVHPSLPDPKTVIKSAILRGVCKQLEPTALCSHFNKAPYYIILDLSSSKFKTTCPQHLTFKASISKGSSNEEARPMASIKGAACEAVAPKTTP